MTQLVEHFEAAIAALEAQDLDGAEAACAAAIQDGVARDHVALRFISFMVSWLAASAEEESLDEIDVMLEQGIAVKEPEIAARIVMDLSDMLMAADEADEAEHALRTLCDRDDLDDRTLFDLLAMRVEIALDYHEDPEEALEILAEVGDEFGDNSSYISLQAGIITELGRGEEAADLLGRAIAANDETDLRYQLGMVLRALGEHEAAADQLLTVRGRDIDEAGLELDEAIPQDQAADLKRQLEDIFETLPDPVMRRVASVAIRVEPWASEDAVRAGADPRSAVYFEGEPDSEEGDDGTLEAVVIYHGVLLAQIADDDEIVDLMTLGLVEEFDRFFGLELIPGV